MSPKSDLETDLTNDEIDFIISGLALPDTKIQVAVDYANHKTSSTNVQAYAKLAGSSWTYYVRSLNVVIGRTSEPATGDNEVQIDLGPAKVVSRKHATIQYNGEHWELSICGRNGVKVDRVLLKEGTTRLYSGNVLDIGGVQMMFVLPDIKPKIAMGFRKKLAIAGNSFKQGATSVMSQDPFQKVPLQQQQLPPQSQGPFTDELPSQPQFPNVYPLAVNNQLPMYPAQPMAQPQFNQYPPQPVVFENNNYSYNSIPTGYTTQFSTNVQPVYEAKQSYSKGPANMSRPWFSSAGTQFFDQDLSHEDAKDTKPPFSYATMISQAILTTPDHQMSLADIYEWISSRYSFYRFSKSGWQNSIRHNLSLNKAFEKVPRRADEPGKGMKWQIVSQYKEEFLKKAMQGDHIKGKNTLAQMQRQVHLKQANNGAPASTSAARSRASSTASMNAGPGNPNPLPLMESQPTLNLATEAVDVEAATVVAGLATSPLRVAPKADKMKAPVSPKVGEMHKENAAPRETFTTPRKTVISDAVGYSDQYGYSAVSDTSLSTPSPSHRYPAAPISQLEAYTPDRGSRKGAWKGGIPQSTVKMAEVTPINKTITAETLSRAVTNASNNSSTTSLVSTGSSTSSAINTANTSLSSITPADDSAAKLPSSATKPSSTTGAGSNIVASLASVSQTPAPMKSNLQLMPPTSAQQQQLPSSFMPASSPAPFWRFMQLNSTPVRAADFSPTKYSSPLVSSLDRTGGSGLSCPGGSSLAPKSGSGGDEGLGDLQNVDLTR